MRSSAILVALVSLGFALGSAIGTPVGEAGLPATGGGETVAVGELRGGACYFEEVTGETQVTPKDAFRYERLTLTLDCRLERTLDCRNALACPEEYATVAAKHEPGLIMPLSHCAQTTGHVASAFWTEGLQAHYIDPPGVQNGVREDRLTEVWNELYYYWSCSDGQPYVWSANGNCEMNTGNGWHLHSPCQNPKSCSYLSGSYCRTVRGDTFGCHNINFCTLGSHYEHMLEGGIRIWNDNFLSCSRTWSGSLPPHGDTTHLDWYCVYL